MHGDAPEYLRKSLKILSRRVFKLHCIFQNKNHLKLYRNAIVFSGSNVFECSYFI